MITFANEMIRKGKLSRKSRLMMAAGAQATSVPDSVAEVIQALLEKTGPEGLAELLEQSGQKSVVGLIKRSHQRGVQHTLTRSEQKAVHKLVEQSEQKGIVELLSRHSQGPAIELIARRPGRYELKNSLHSSPKKKRKATICFHAPTLEALRQMRLESLQPKRYAISVVTSLYTQAEMAKIEEFARNNNFKLNKIERPTLRKEELLLTTITHLNSPEAMAKKCGIVMGYDYAWVKRAIDKDLFPDSTDLKIYSFTKFKKYMDSLGFTNCAGAKTLAKYYNKAHGKELPWTFDDCLDRHEETKRRNDLVAMFVEMMHEVWQAKNKKPTPYPSRGEGSWG